jgi:hypothetical protein
VPLPDDLLGEAPVRAAVAALADRNRHHLEQMTDAERDQALTHWHELAVAVLAAAGAAVHDEPEPVGEPPGRAVIVFEDTDEDEIAIHLSFFPQLDDLGDGEVAATPAQAAALDLLEGMAGEDPPGVD